MSEGGNSFYERILTENSDVFSLRFNIITRGFHVKVKPSLRHQMSDEMGTKSSKQTMISEIQPFFSPDGVAGADISHRACFGAGCYWGTGEIYILQ